MSLLIAFRRLVLIEVKSDFNVSFNNCDFRLVFKSEIGFDDDFAPFCLKPRAVLGVF